MNRTLPRLGIALIVSALPVLAAADGFVASAGPESGSLTLILIGTVLAVMSFIKLRKRRE